jgi:hypothetical protein
MTISKQPTKQGLEGAIAAEAEAPGAIPPTGGVPPQDAPPASIAREDRSAADDLVDGIDLMLRAARRATRSVETRIEATAERVLIRLKQFDESVERQSERRAALDRKQLEAIATDAGRDIAALVERVAQRVESVLGRPDESRRKEQ